MQSLTAFLHGSIPRDEKDATSLDLAEVFAGRCDDRIEHALGALDHLRSSLTGASGLGGIRLHDDDLPAR